MFPSGHPNTHSPGQIWVIRENNNPRPPNCPSSVILCRSPLLGKFAECCSCHYMSFYYLFVVFSLLSVALINTVIAKRMPLSPKMATSCSPEPMNMLPYTAKRTLQKQFRILRWENHLGLPRWVECNHKGAYKRETRGSKSERGDVTMETGVGVVHFENGHELRSWSSLQKQESTRKWVLPCSLRC